MFKSHFQKQGRGGLENQFCDKFTVFLGNLNAPSLISMEQNVQPFKMYGDFLFADLLILTSVTVNSMLKNNNYISLMNSVLMNVLQIIYDLINSVP